MVSLSLYGSQHEVGKWEKSEYLQLNHLRKEEQMSKKTKGGTECRGHSAFTIALLGTGYEERGLTKPSDIRRAQVRVVHLSCACNPP